MKRMNWLDKLIVAAILILLAALLQKGAEAEDGVLRYTLKNDSVELVLLDGKCESPQVLEFLTAARPDLLPRFKKALGNFKFKNGQWKLLQGCWIEFSAEETGTPKIGTVWEDMDRYLVPKEAFTKAKAV